MRPERGIPIRVSALCAALLVPALWPGTAAAQQEGGAAASDTAAGAAPRDTAAVADTGVDVTYRREVFTYPLGQRPDPFRPADAGSTSGPRFTNLVLAGVIHAPEIGSVAILRDVSNGRRHRVRDGESIGQARVVEIRRGEVVFSVTGATGQRREVLRAEREEEESQR